MDMLWNHTPDGCYVGGITCEVDTLGLRVDDVLHVLVYLPNVGALRLAVAVLALKISEKTHGLPLAGSRVLVRLVECHRGGAS
jgi:hypothetical protein